MFRFDHIATAARLASEAAKRVAEQVERPHLPVPQRAVNAALAHYTREVAEVRDVAVEVRDGRFDVGADLVRVRGFRVPSARVTASFKVAEAHVSADRQFLVLNQVGRTGVASPSAAKQMVWDFAGALFGVFTDTDPAQFLAQRAPGVVVNGSLYTVDLSAYNVHQLIHQTPALQPLLRANTHVQGIECRDGQFNVYLNADVDQLKREAGQIKDKVTRVFGEFKRAKETLLGPPGGVPPKQLPPSP